MHSAKIDRSSRNKHKPEIPEGFIHWNGGECPVNLRTEIDVIFRCGDTDTGRAKSFRWDHANSIADIIAYQVITGTMRVSRDKLKKLSALIRQIDEVMKDLQK